MKRNNTHAGTGDVLSGTIDSSISAGLILVKTGPTNEDHMSPEEHKRDQERINEIIAEARSYRDQQERSYRGQALKLFPPICGHCGREFSGDRLRELTVHHKDSNHHNNPPDGSNWELLCLYCHDYEHSSYMRYGGHDTQQPGYERKAQLTFMPFANLKDLLEDKLEEET